MVSSASSFKCSKLLLPVLVSLRRIRHRLEHGGRVAGRKCLFESFVKKLVEMFLVLLRRLRLLRGA
jgi:hypothetical protein